MNKRAIFYLVLAAILLLSTNGFCRDDEQVYAIQERVFHRNHELALCFGYVPDEDYFNAYPVGLGYTYHFNNALAWEVVRGQYMFTQEKDLKGDLEEGFGVTPEQFLEPKYMIHSNLIIKPFYGKQSIWNRGIINNETYFILGGGMVTYEKKYSDGEKDAESDPSISLGFGTRYFLAKNLCMNLEIRDLVNLKKDNTENNVYFGAALSVQFNLLPRKSRQDRTIDRLQDYLEGSNDNG